MRAARAERQAQDEGERPGASPDAQPELRPERAPEHPAGVTGGRQTHQDRNSALRPQLHLGTDGDAAHGGAARTQGLPARMEPERIIIIIS